MAAIRGAARRRGARAGALTLALLAAVAAPALALGAGTYKGKSSQHEPVSLREQGGVIRVLRVAWMASCKRSGYFLGTADAPLRTKQTGITLGKHSSWLSHARYTAPPVGGYVERFTVSDSGSFGRHGTVHGSFSGAARVYKAKGGRFVTSCSSGKVTFTLTRAR